MGISHNGKNRDQLLILASILEAANSGAGKTRIMLQANLSFRLLEKYLNRAIEAGLLTASGTKIALTEEGKRFLYQYRAFEKVDNEVQKAVDRLLVERARLLQFWETRVQRVVSN